MSRIDVVHDCDPGNDDAVAILAAIGHPGIALRAVTTTYGHLAGDRTARNAAIAVAAAGADVPVHAGASAPLVRERLIARLLDFDSGLDAPRPQLAAVPLAVGDSVSALRAAVEAHPGLTIVATGPLTNLARLLTDHPETAAGIGRIVTLGAAWGLGTKTPSAEWNVVSDPDAAAIVYAAPVPVTIVPVDASATVPIDADLVAAVAGRPGPGAALAAELLASLEGLHTPPVVGPPGCPLHDPCAILVAADASLATVAPAQVEVDLRPGLTYGRTVFNFRPDAHNPANVDVVVTLDPARTRAALVDALAGLS
ncbi:nucleoside hydrolase [Acuticoccus mangrovi]|uniref:Nucleoside hydrolase n=1 Tax=Acuticoccus mangrovi TaxID=2796142 RepID=A0A934MHR3_9HYPH|nr:nucleoside hydrolase [Acuticoccus mangrovi]